MSIYLQDGSFIPHQLIQIIERKQSVNKECGWNLITTIGRNFSLTAKDYHAIVKFIKERNYPLVCISNGIIVNPNNILLEKNTYKHLETFSSYDWILRYSNEGYQIRISQSDYDVIKNYNLDQPLLIDVQREPDRFTVDKQLEALIK